MKIYDCFTFFNEFELLEWRLKLLYDVVDCFVIVEMNRTFQNHTKPFNYEENQARFLKYQDKIRYIKVTDDIDCQDNWTLEIFQRNCIMRGLTNCAPDDIIMIGDIDEFVDPRVMQQLRDNQVAVHTYQCFGPVAERSGLRGISRNGRCFFNTIADFSHRNDIHAFLDHQALVCEQRMFEFFVNYECQSHWCGTILLRYCNLKEPQQLRRKRNQLPMILNGWHFSSMGGIQAIKKKFRATSDGMGNPVFQLPEQEQEEYIAKELDHGRIWWSGEQLTKHELKELDIPYLDWLAGQYPQMVRMS